MVLAKLEERDAVAMDGNGPWPGAAELERIEHKLTTLRTQWQQDQVSDDFFFNTVRQLEASQSELRNQRSRHEAATQRAIADVANVRKRWMTPANEGGYDISQKRAVTCEALHAVVVLPAGKGNGSRGTFNPNLLAPIWRRE